MPINELNADTVFWGGIFFILSSIAVGILIRLYFAKQR